VGVFLLSIYYIRNYWTACRKASFYLYLSGLFPVFGIQKEKTKGDFTVFSALRRGAALFCRASLLLLLLSDHTHITWRIEKSWDAGDRSLRPLKIRS
jgi:hypothetical protein